MDGNVRFRCAFVVGQAKIDVQYNEKVITGQQTQMPPERRALSRKRTLSCHILALSIYNAHDVRHTDSHTEPIGLPRELPQEILTTTTKARTLTKAKAERMTKSMAERHRETEIAWMFRRFVLRHVSRVPHAEEGQTTDQSRPHQFHRSVVLSRAGALDHDFQLFSAT